MTNLNDEYLNWQLFAKNGKKFDPKLEVIAKQRYESMKEVFEPEKSLYEPLIRVWDVFTLTPGGYIDAYNHCLTHLQAIERNKECKKK